MAPDRNGHRSIKPGEWVQKAPSTPLKNCCNADYNCNYHYGANRKEVLKSPGVENQLWTLGKASAGSFLAWYRQKKAFVTFSGIWTLISVIALCLNALNVDWDVVPTWLGISFVLITTLLHTNIFESVLIAAAAIIMGGHGRPVRVAPYDHLTLLINYNILAVFTEDIDETMETMYRAYMGNLCRNTSCVLVSATSDPALKEYELDSRDRYRKQVYETLYKEGMNFIRGEFHAVNNMRYKHVWFPYSHARTDVFVNEELPRMCQHFADQFMVVHRVSRVLKKCGQYQDLMLLSEGDNCAFSYTDPDLYGKRARPYGEPLFHHSPDVERIHGRRFDYTLVLDGDTYVPEGHCYELLSIGAAYPDKGIIQPDIRIVTQPDDTIFMRIESMRQHLSGPTTNAMAAMLGQVSFFGKGLIKNRIYIDLVIGTRERPLELVPIDVLSHDTYEAACLKPLYAGSVFLVEAPCRNYITWNIRETRWNTGDIILAVHFWPKTFGRLIRWLQSIFQKKNYTPIRVRGVPHFDLITAYVAHSAIRHMAMKMFLFVYLFLRTAVVLRNPRFPDLNVTFFILLFPKFAVYNGQNLKLIFLEMVISFLQFSPDIFAGVIRVFVALKSILQTTPKWIPQRAIEEQFQKSNNFLLSFRELWLITICALMLSFVTLTQSYSNSSLLISADYVIFIVTALILPFYCGVTSSRMGPLTERLLK